MKNKDSFYITAPIFYPNAKLHMGHAYTTTLCDILARYNRLNGKETYFLTGADENTEKVVRAANTAGQKVGQYLDQIVDGFKELYEKLDISYDQFIRTTDEKSHWLGAIEFWNRMVASGDLEKRSYEGLYCIGHESFITEKDLVDGKCPEHNEVPQRVKEENYFFKLSKYTKKIKEAISNDELLVIPKTRKSEILSLLETGLDDISFSRPADKMTLGIPVPGDSTQKIYVWGDALTSYVTALGFGGQDDAKYEKFWPANLHVIGKDILRFHAAIWPGMLMSAGLPLPKNILVHGLITSGGLKMSKTLGNVVDPDALIREYGADAVRYYLARHVTLFEDGDITPELFKEAYNAHLANGVGNLTSRILKLTSTHLKESGLMSKQDIWNHSTATVFTKHLDQFDIQTYCNEVWKLVSANDRLIQETEPFKLLKSEKQSDIDKGIDILVRLRGDLWRIAVLLEPILPSTSAKIQECVKANKMPAESLFMRK